MFDKFGKMAHVIGAMVGKAMGVKVVFGQRGPSTDGKTIYLPADVAPPEAGIGYTIHEGGHIAHTDMEVFRRFAARGAVHKNVLNILEDVRVERRVCRRYKGARKRLQEAVESLDWADIGPDMAANVLNWLLYEARQKDMPALFQELAARHENLAIQVLGQDAVSEIKSRIQSALDAPDTKASADLAGEIIEILKNSMPSMPEPQPDASSQSSESGQDRDKEEKQGGGDGSQGEPDRSNDGSSGASGEPSNDQDGDGASDGDSEDQSEEGSTNGQAGGDASEGETEGQADGSEAGDGQAAAKQGQGRQGSADAMKALEEAAKAVQEGLGERLGKQIASGGGGASIYTLPEREGTTHLPIDNALVARSASALRARMQTLTRRRRGLRDVGHDVVTDRLACLAANDPYIFNRPSTVRAIDASCVVLLDASGSMASDRKADIAGQAAVVIHNALLSLNQGKHKVESQMVGFSDCLIRFGTRRMHRAPRLAMAGTPTADAVAQLLPELALSRRKEKVMFIVTDGVPNDGRATMEVIQAARREGFKVFTIIIGMSEFKGIILSIFDKDRTSFCDDIKDVPKALADAVSVAFNLPK